MIFSSVSSEANIQQLATARALLSYSPKALESLDLFLGSLHSVSSPLVRSLFRTLITWQVKPIRISGSIIPKDLGSKTHAIVCHGLTVCFVSSFPGK